MKRSVIGLLLLCSVLAASAANASRVWEDMAIQLSNGEYIWATVDRNGSCYDLQVGTPMGSNTGIYGNASNCSSDINGYWSTHACSRGSETVNGGIGEVIKNVIQRCQ